MYINIYYIQTESHDTVVRLGIIEFEEGEGDSTPIETKTHVNSSLLFGYYYI